MENIKGFFEDHQVKRYSFNDKIKWIFEQYIFGTADFVPFDGISVIVNNKMIIIKGINFEYSFPPDMTIKIWNSTKKALHQCK